MSKITIETTENGCRVQMDGAPDDLLSDMVCALWTIYNKSVKTETVSIDDFMQGVSEGVKTVEVYKAAYKACNMS